MEKKLSVAMIVFVLVVMVATGGEAVDHICTFKCEITCRDPEFKTECFRKCMADCTHKPTIMHACTSVCVCVYVIVKDEDWRDGRNERMKILSQCDDGFSHVIFCLVHRYSFSGVLEEEESFHGEDNDNEVLARDCGQHRCGQHSCGGNVVAEKAWTEE
uniref:Plant thionin family protein n=1 Tax=Brassica oleracea TaxID=3712 RepID=A0A3P6EAM0_BRAOL|nr:unnamed protein product [Brassica oleracea]